jgi:hypothetical protein
MKVILFVLFPAFLFSQSAISDTAFIENRADGFWQVKTVVYDNGRKLTEESPIGADTATTLNAIIGQIYPDFQAYADGAVNAIKRYSAMRQILSSANNSLLQISGSNYTTSLAGLIGDEFLGQYTIRVNGALIDAEIIRLPSGPLRFRQGGTNFVVDIISRNWIRIRRYQGTSTQATDQASYVDFFQDNTGIFYEASQGIGRPVYILRKKRQ